jgi:chitodextrinase
MKLQAKLALVLTVLTSFYTQSNAQIVPDWEYFHYRTDGTRVAGAVPGGVTGAIPVDIRLTNYEFGPGVPNNFYLTEGSTFSFRRDNAGNLTNSYHPMAGFNSATWYTEGRLMSFAYNERLRMNYRLIKPKNYPTNPNVEGGYPLIVMTHGFGERANCWGSNCYWSNAFWNTTDNNPQAVTYGISSASGSSGSSPTTFTTVGNHNLLVNQQVVIRNSTVTAYNGTRTITAVTGNTFTVNINFSGTTSANVSRTGVFELLNNDHSMTHGGNVHQTAVHLSTIGNKVPDDPTMPARAFPGFVLFPQNLNGWEQGGAENVVRIIRLLMQTYNINPNKIYVHGLSDGGSAVYRLVRTAPWLFAAALPMSAVNNPENNYPIYQHFNNIPLWVFQGGVDTNPNKTTTEQLIQNFRNAGMNVRYTLYPTLGHGVWNNAYNEPDFFSWMRTKDKSEIFVKFGNATVCSTSGAAAELILSQGFLAYQWERDGETIVGANASSYSATLPGTYRARFSRVANPNETDWNKWSDPVVVTESAPTKPTIETLGSAIFSTINSDQKVVLIASEKNDKYYWSKDNNPVNDARSLNGSTYYGVPPDSLSMLMRDSWASPQQFGSYTLRTASFSGCQSLPSDPVYMIFAATATLTTPGSFNGIAQSPTSIFLTWADNSPNESGFEIWRRTSGETTFTYVGVTKEDDISYLDTQLIPGTVYEYKLRGVSSTARSLHAPSEDPNINLEVETPFDEAAPTPPQNLHVTLNSINSISLAWDSSTDNGGINQYVISYGANSVSTLDNETTFTLTNLSPNTAYPITVRAEDFAGNLSEPSNLVIGTTYVDGLYYEHSTGAWSSLDPVASQGANDSPPINWTTAEFTGKVNNFKVNPINVEPPATPGIATQEDFYKIKFDGYLLISNPATLSPATLNNTYQFRIISDDRSMVYLHGFDPANFNNNRILSHNTWTEGYIYKPTGNITLNQGYYPITVLFNEYTESQSLSVEYRRRIAPSSPATYTAWTPIPDAMLRSGNYTSPADLTAPTSLAATANGMTSVDLTWVYGGSSSHEFEVYRATVVDGDYTIVGRGTGLAFTDDTAEPSTTYFYKLKTINVTTGASSPFSTTASATTASDAIAPSIPQDVALISNTFTNVAFSWTASTDNVGVTGYEILINNNPVGTSSVTSYMATDLEPGTQYNFTVKAFDATGNKSAASSPVLQVTTNAGVMYYSKSSGPLSVATNWGANPDGTGTVPNFTYNGQYYMVANRASTGLGGALNIGGSISKLIVPTGTTLTVDNTISAKIEVQGNAVVNLNNTTTAPEFLSVSPTSTVNFNNYAYIPAGTYGHVSLTGTGNKNFAEGETVIMGNLNATTGIALKGVSGNASQVRVHGDITLAGTPGVVATDNALDLTLAKAGTQTLTVSGALDLFKLSTNSGTNVNVVGSGITINVGSPNGGGLVLANGTTLNLGNNHLVMKNAATINAGGQTGKLAINGSNLTLSSSSTQNSNLHFDATLKTAGLVTTTFSSTGKLMVQSPVNITDGLKIKAGEVSSAGNITLVSTQTKTAYLQELEGNGSVTGNAKVERWVSIARKYRYMSSVVANMTVALWQQGGMPITGPFTGTSGSQTPSMFSFHEPDINPNAVPPHNGYSRFPVSSNSEMLVRGRGYSIFNYNGNNPLVLTMTGNPYHGSIPFPTLTAGTGNPAAYNGQGDGWNLVGNPYASAIQWSNLASEWTKSGLSNFAYVPDNTGPTLTYRSYDAAGAGGIIAPGQAFWVKAITASPALTIHEKAKRTSTSTFYREGDVQVNSITIRLSNGTAEDVAYITLDENYSDAYEPETDGVKFKNQVLNLSTRSSNNVNLVFNKLSDSFCEKTVALVLEDVTPGTYTLAFDNIENLVGVGAVALTDHFTNTTVAITNSTPYSFAVTTAAASFGAARFSLTLNRPALQKNAIASVANLCGGTSATIQLTNTQPGVFYYATRVNEATPISEIVADETGMQLTIPVSALQAGANSVVIHTGFKGCSDELLTTTPLVFNYTPSPLVAVEKPFLSLCAESQINLKAETNSANSLHWYKDGVLIANQTSANWISDPLKKTTLFEVAAVSNGCEGPKTSVYVEINRVEMPLVEFTGKNLEIVNDIPADNFIQWYINNSPLDEYDRGITPTEEGIYTVLVAKGGCSVVSEPFEYLVTGVENPFNEPFNAYVYPNPATFDQLYVKLETPSKQNATVTLVDLTGRTVFTQAINGNEGNGVHKLNVEQDTTPGLYILHIKQGNAILQRKVILQFK